MAACRRARSLWGGLLPGLGRDSVQVGNGPAQHRRAPDLPGAGLQPVARGVAFDAQGVEPGIGVLDGKVQAEGIPFVGADRAPAQGTDERRHRLGETVAVGCGRWAGPGRPGAR